MTLGGTSVGSSSFNLARDYCLLTLKFPGNTKEKPARRGDQIRQKGSSLLKNDPALPMALLAGEGKKKKIAAIAEQMGLQGKGKLMGI